MTQDFPLPRNPDYLTPAGFAHAVRTGEIDFLDALALAPEVLQAKEGKHGWNWKENQENQKVKRILKKRKSTQ